MNPTKNQHVQLPSSEVIEDINPKDLLIYITIKRFMNKDSYEAFPSMRTLCQLSGASEPTVKKSIDKLIKADYITLSKKGRNKLYIFNKDKSDKFEKFSYEFLDNGDLTFQEKSYILASQRYMYKHEGTQTGSMTFTTREQEKNINMPYSTISKIQKSLQQKGYLDIVKTSAKELETGCNKNLKVFQLGEIGQALIFTTIDHEDRISQLEKLVNELVHENKILKKHIRETLPKPNTFTL